MSESGRPFAKQARALCPESDEHHDKVWFCETCWMLERRLTPMHLLPGFAELLAEADLSVTIKNPFAGAGDQP